jgi:periplasmic protein TonB
MESPFALVAVTALHLLLVGGLVRHMSEPRVAVVPPAVVGMLVTAPPMVEPVPLPMIDQPRLAPRPVARRQPTPPLPVAAPSERTVTASPPEPEASVAVEAAAQQVPPWSSPAPEAAPQPVVPPRADAAHLNNPAPVYPSISRRLGEQGCVQLDVYILADGSVGEIKLKRSSGFPRLDQAALEAVRNWRYQPARRGNEAIAFWYVQPLTFSLEG